MQASDFVLKFLASIGRPSEAALYLSLFRADRRRFAIISVPGAVLADAPDALCADLRFLGRLGLTPVIALDPPGGSGSSANASAPPYQENHAAFIIDRLAPEVACQIAVRSEDAGTIAQAGAIPIVTAGRAAIAALATDLQTRKVVLLGRTSGLLPCAPEGAPPLSLIDLSTEYDELSRPGVLTDDQRADLSFARALIDAVPHRMTVAVTSPFDLLRELFTERGAGTLIRRGSEIASHESYGEVDRERLADLLRSAFGKPASPALWQRPPLAVYIAGDYLGAAILTATSLGPYLSKFAASARARGEGIGRDLWRHIERGHDTLFWRSRPDNPITRWYMDNCDGMARAHRWWVFWRGLASDRIAGAIAYAQNAPPDF